MGFKNSDITAYNNLSLFEIILKYGTKHIRACSPKKQHAYKKAVMEKKNPDF